MGITRRDFLKAAAAGTVITGIGLPGIAFGADKKVKIGFLAPLTGRLPAGAFRDFTGVKFGQSGSMPPAGSKSAAIIIW